MKYPTVARSLSILTICFLLSSTAEAYLVHVYATSDSYRDPIDACVSYVTNCAVKNETKIATVRKQTAPVAHYWIAWYQMVSCLVFTWRKLDQWPTQPKKNRVGHSKVMRTILGNLIK
ncbi:23757_t:CDS:2 [Cetraspora pellucida]|uniref:23757_t:CDS:1 n=1 Tax=Cetraspora pellucida TaxID=1433469 RepID=A0A9N9NY89_9GLOM|nr:23757_t:CDS:2 [Cetraspora pellucida]